MALIDFVMSKKYTTNEVIAQFRNAHGDKFDYSLVDYKGSNIPVQIICPEHGRFKTRRETHINSKFGCSECQRESMYYTTEEFVKQSQKIHGDRYDYSCSNYIGTNKPVAIICKNHGVFQQHPDAHKRGQGCPSCARRGFDPEKDSILYLLKFKGSELYKIGITNRSVNKRYSISDRNKFDILWTIPFKGKDAILVERYYKSQFKEHKYKGPRLLDSASNDEIFTKNIFFKLSKYKLKQLESQT